MMASLSPLGHPVHDFFFHVPVTSTDIQARHSDTISISCILHYNRLVILLMYRAATRSCLYFYFQGSVWPQKPSIKLRLPNTNTDGWFMLQSYVRG